MKSKWNKWIHVSLSDDPPKNHIFFLVDEDGIKHFEEDFLKILSDGWKICL